MRPDIGSPDRAVRVAVDHGRRLARRIAWSVLSKMLGAATHVLPRRHHVVVNGFPPLEGNAVEIVRELQRRYDGRIIWIDAPSDRELAGVQLKLSSGVRTARYWSLAALYSYVTAETIFYTHGLYGNPRLAASRTVVNLWHGHGIKRVDYPGYATHMVVPSQMHASTRATAFRVNPANVLIALPPRATRLLVPTTRMALSELGLNGRPFVLWMPTYRKAAVKTGTNDGWVESEENVDGFSTTQSIRRGIDVLRAKGIDVVVKAHPADAMNRDIPGAINISTDQLAAAQTTLYNLLGASAGLITDYSSVWFEYMITRKPVAYFMPDKLNFAATRGVVPSDALDWLPGPELVTEVDFDRFGTEILGGGCFEELRERSSQRFGLNVAWTARGSVLDELARRNLLHLYA